MMLTTRRYPVYALTITKCGSTFVKNLFWFLDHDAPHPAGDRIHDRPEDLLRADDLDPAFIRASRFRFTVLRDPADRVLSLYLDKLWGDGPGSFLDLRARLVRERGLDLDPGLDAEGHGRNLERLLPWLAADLGRPGAEVNPHWRPQVHRLRRARAMAPVALLLDGLDWQLPAFLGPAVPGIAEAMAAVTARNRAPRAFRREEVLTPDLAARLRALYPEDAARVETARAEWERRRAAGWRNPARGAARPARGEAVLRLTGTHRTPLAFMAVPKCGCTFLRNLAYLIDHGRPHPDPLGIQADRCLVTVEVSARSHGGRAFLVLRDPVARFLSLYFDKVAGSGPHAFPWLAERLAARGGFAAGPGLGPEAHRRNCHVLLDFIESRFAREGPEAVNGHWRPQAAFAARARPFGLALLPLGDLGPRLAALHARTIPELPALIARLGPLNPSAARPDILDPALEARILALYPGDRALHAEAQAAGPAPP